MTLEEIKAAIVSLSPEERAEIMTQLCAWANDGSGQAEGDNPSGVREKLAEAAKGRFTPGDQSSIKIIRSNLE